MAITERGKEVLASKPDRVDVNYLRQFPEFEEFRTKTRVRDSPMAEAQALDPDANPEELLYGTYESLRGRRGRHPRPAPVGRPVVGVLRTSRRRCAGQDGVGSDVEETSRRVTKRSGDDGIDEANAGNHDP